ncbi:MAG TPA: hypothetical protein VLC94_05400 [Candidatus Acidoferrum sp.]|nr:hypothetical protein [Candidatus Acidoferrum sp.]
MWRTVPGIALSALPRRWRAPSLLEQAIPWVRSAILSGMIESIFAVVGLIYWYSHSVTTWAANVLDSALNNGPGAGADPHLLGLSAFVIWCIHPLTWLLASFFVEGLVRLTAAVSTEQVLPLWPLAFADWAYGKITRRPPEGDNIHLPSGREQLRGLVSAAKQAAFIARTTELADELVPSGDGLPGHDFFLEIRSSRPKPDWTPPRIIRIHSAYYSLEAASEGRRPRPFVFRLRRLAAGVHGRSVLTYEPPEDLEAPSLG